MRSRYFYWLLALYLIGLLVCIVTYFTIGRWLITLAYNNTGPDYLNRLITNTDNGPIDYYFRKGSILFSRGLLCYSVLFALFAAWVYSREVYQVIRQYFTEADSPINLAVFRIITFAILFAIVDAGQVRLFASLPKVLQCFPAAGGGILKFIPIFDSGAWIAAMVLKICCLFGAIGLFTRMTTILALLLGLYVLGIPQCYGKVNHYHHVVWFTALLAASPCGDALSVDALFRPVGKSIGQKLLGPPSSQAYALPLRFAWILLAIAYFFPGFWKYWNCGYAWGLEDNLQLLLYRKWAELGDWRPLVRIDQVPGLLTIGGIGTIIFEMFFIALIFNRKTRILAAIVGVMFHNMTGMLMNIWFLPLQVFYLTFIPWNWIVHRLIPWYRSATAPLTPPVRLQMPVVTLGILLIVSNIICGVLRIGNGWPVTLYPTFAGFGLPERRSIEIVGVEGANEEQVPLGAVRESLAPERLVGLIETILQESDPELKKRKLEAFIEVVRGCTPEFRKYTQLRIYDVAELTHPDQVHEPPTNRILLVKVDFPGTRRE